MAASRGTSSRGAGGTSGGKKKRAWKTAEQEDAKIPHLVLGDITEIDGSVKEGGGQILRISIALSCLLRKNVHISNIRAGRSTPGLRPQHLTGLQLVARICNGRLVGGSPGSTEVYFYPEAVQGGRHVADVKTAGSICLLLQIALPCLLFAKERSELLLRGGTDVDMAPPINYTLKVFKPLAEAMGVHFECTINQRGFFPKGRGEVLITLDPVHHLKPITLLDRGDINGITIEAFTAGLVHRKVSHEMIAAAKFILEKNISLATLPSGIKTDPKHLTEQEAFGNGSGIISVVTTTSGCVFGSAYNGSKTESADRCGQRVGEELVKVLSGEACVDDYMQDQLIILMALAKGCSRIKTGPLTLHTETAIHIVETLTDVRFHVLRNDGSPDTCLIECDGLGLES
ncbi:PREDICTED: RNA 3'-terminal phosphate cyclase-like [Amphimedon queenslandica]|uniref:RNA 3'-terminal phosphate cyclase n=1 Tax=Amphimedon queenslandica TaxID=400682 RepID=A0A1X7V059_AMPQE|nr:PREDICTED: RNA 3'-terminal phosphate cyclase-like [Amphimedon queenslandica]|eukprot:XP_019851369.1 PREDICTED: RNA 3'-terminal phosphate cyclase-like [Amphimedon queenslandica]